MTSRIHSDMAAFVPGYDPVLFKWLAGRIAKTIIDAAQTSKPARIALYEGVSCSLQVNRSLQAFAKT